MEDEIQRLRADVVELRRLLNKHQWAGLAPAGAVGACPECAGSAPPEGRGHRPGCALAAALVSSAATAS
jgi:hypothetical protein